MTNKEQIISSIEVMDFIKSQTPVVMKRQMEPKNIKAKKTYEEEIEEFLNTFNKHEKTKN